ncbi:two-component system sensor histidine kinase MprB [Actinoplanes tereljensis]|uniref:HAMP domain-containing sensor histidine kinase n=1 Tax=Paractinoplanes tereljensis TaxID=571912 RepID=UPI0019450753|nr:HAMP domain-containing sensor histidine kinase [Actinoplanes tereljensis]
MSAWWRRRTLHSRVALLVTAAVSAALVALSVGAWLAVAEIQHHQTQSQLTADASAIAAQPDQWLSAGGTLPDPGQGHGDGHGPHQLGPRWQILDRTGAVISDTSTPLPVTARARQIAAGGKRSAEEKVGDYLMLTVPATGGGAVQVAISQEQDDDVLQLFGALLAAGCLLGAAGAALLGRLVARSGLAPVQQLTAAVENVTVTMDLEQHLAVEGTDEVARLGTSVNTLLEAIDAARQAQRTLIEDASHELRTPLTSIRTNIELLLTVERNPDLAHRLPPEERENLLADLDAQIRELATLTTELVELARAESTREDPEEVDLAEVTEAAINRVRMRAPGLTFDADLHPSTVHGRPGELERMIVNVLDNAAKFSPPATTVHIRLSAGDDSGTCTLTVADRGPGIDAADRPHVFGRFYRATAARSMPGSGLGLAIVAQTAAQHGGTVTAEPNTPNGTVVTIRLPRPAYR